MNAPRSQDLQELVRRILEVSRPLRIVLFGSHARGQSGAHSDMDILVVVPSDSHRREVSALIYRNLVGFGRAVDLVVATPEDLERAPPSLVYRTALRDGRELYHVAA